MSRSLFWRLTLLLLCVFCATARAQIYQGKQLVQAEMLASTTAVVAGQPFLIGLRLRMTPGWHTYWKYPGDAGIPTDVKWQLPVGWKVGPIQWPIPQKLNEPGDIQIYGYRDEALLVQKITPPARLTAESSVLAAKVNWLVCEKICIPGEASLSLQFPVAATAQSANGEIFARVARQFPRSRPNDLSASWKSDPAGLTLDVSSPSLPADAALDFYPSPAENVAVGHPRLEGNHAGHWNFRIPLDAANHAFTSLPGLLVLKSQTSEEAWEISADAPSAKSSETAATTNWSDLMRFLVFGFIGGFILNLMPCVLPVISLKIFGFVQQAGQDRARILRSGLAFIAGIFVWFLGLALVLVLLKSAGHEITWAFQFTNPYFVLAMSVVVLVFALNLFGVFEVTLPQWLNRGATEAGSAHGDAGSFFQGVFATMLATPCTAPFLGTALGFAFTQSATVILFMFGSIAAGMSAPYLLLSAQPGWLRFLPKPGPWMVRVKQLMGFLLLATLLFLLSVLGSQRGLGAVTWTSSFLLVVSVACWLFGGFVTPLATPRGRVATLLTILVLLAAAGFYFIGEKFPRTVASSNPTENSAGWEKFTPERLATELQEGRPVFIDFTAEWCITCKFNESAVLETAAVRSAFTQREIVKLKADWTNGDPAITKMLKQFGRPGVPLYVLYPGNTAEPFVFPELLTKNILLEKLETINKPIAYH
ncbi:MAG: protein-disulfide reductase DsbD domain-containing protein [Verrucomicrobiota bacterium]